jgi:hypothetical protein
MQNELSIIKINVAFLYLWREKEMEVTSSVVGGRGEKERGSF